jgi:Domain of unknown function (DUF4411)
MIYLLDANTLIEAKNRYYSMTICPGYWSWILQSYGQGVVASIETVGQELQQGNDDLAQWAKQHSDLFWQVSDDATQAAFSEVATYVANSAAQMKPGAVEEFLAGADPWLIAKAMSTQDCVLVTHEQLNLQRKNKFIIPNVCQHFGVTWVDTFQVLDATDAAFYQR